MRTQSKMYVARAGSASNVAPRFGVPVSEVRYSAWPRSSRIRETRREKTRKRLLKIIMLRVLIRF